MTRSEAREYMMTVVFQMDVLDCFDVDMKEKFLSVKGEKHSDYCSEVYSILCNKKETIDSEIQSHCVKWNLDRIPRTDIAILRIAAAEILFLDTPTAVAINEAVELSKKYGEENSPKYINGILGAIAKDNNDGAGDKSKVKDKKESE